MIVLSNTAEQTLQPGESIRFDKVISKTGCSECHRSGTPTVIMRRRAIYNVEFHGNVEGEAAGVVSLALSLNNDAILPETTMNTTIAAADQPMNVGTGTKIPNCCVAYDSVKVENIGTTPIIIQPNCCFTVNVD